MARGASRDLLLSRAVLVAAILVFLVARFQLLSLININWDEFLYLSRVHEFHRGDLTSAFQTFHVHLFQWLVAVPGNEIDQIVAARTAVFGLRLATSVLVFLLALRLSNRDGALVAVLATLVFSHVIRHGESFRADPLIAVLFLLAATLLVWRVASITAVTIAAIALALAASITVKTAIYAPALMGVLAVLLWSVDRGRRRARSRGALLFGVVSAATYALLSLYHAAVTAAPEGEVVQRATASGAGMIGNAQLGILAQTLRTDWPFWILFCAGAIVAILDAARRTGDARGRALLLLGLLLPLASLIVYRNSFDYFYVAIVPMASLACAYGVWRAQARLPVRWQPAVSLVAAAMLAWTGWRAVQGLRFDGIEPQRRLVEGVHAIFPEPVPYLDRCGMISSFPRARVFMSTYILQRYRERGVPAMARIVAEDQPRFLLANVSGLALEQPWDTVQTYERRLLKEDFEFLQNNFVHHWGAIWVPGKRLTLSGSAGTPFLIAVAGPYTVESERAFTIDGVLTHHDDVIQLGAGDHVATGTGSVTLRYGARLPRPPFHPSPRRLFRNLSEFE